MKIKYLKTSNSDFYKKLEQHLTVRCGNTTSIEKSVDQILKAIQKNDDKGLLEQINKYDKTSYKRVSDSIVSKREISEAYMSISKKTLSDLKKAIRNIRKFSKNQKLKSWSIKVKGSELGEKVTPIDRVGIYVPGGKASYPSTVVMNAIPAKILLWFVHR